MAEGEQQQPPQGRRRQMSPARVVFSPGGSTVLLLLLLLPIPQCAAGEREQQQHELEQGSQREALQEGHSPPMVEPLPFTELQSGYGGLREAFLETPVKMEGPTAATSVAAVGPFTAEQVAATAVAATAVAALAASHVAASEEAATEMIQWGAPDAAALPKMPGAEDSEGLTATAATLGDRTSKSATTTEDTTTREETSTEIEDAASAEAGVRTPVETGIGVPAAAQLQETERPIVAALAPRVGAQQSGKEETPALTPAVGHEGGASRNQPNNLEREAEADSPRELGRSRRVRTPSQWRQQQSQARLRMSKGGGGNAALAVASQGYETVILPNTKEGGLPGYRGGDEMFVGGLLLVISGFLKLQKMPGRWGTYIMVLVTLFGIIVSVFGIFSSFLSARRRARWIKRQGSILSHLSG